MSKGSSGWFVAWVLIMLLLVLGPGACMLIGVGFGLERLMWAPILYFYTLPAALVLGLIGGVIGFSSSIRHATKK